MRILLLAISLLAQTPSTYDDALAKKLKADDYGMRKYVMAFLRSGPTPAKDRTESQKLMAGHMANIQRMANEGKLAIAGPFLDNGPLRGIYIFNVETVAEAEALANSDPAIQSGSLALELHPWYGSAALLEVNAIHGRIAKKSH